MKARIKKYFCESTSSFVMSSTEARIILSQTTNTILCLLSYAYTPYALWIKYRLSLRSPQINIILGIPVFCCGVDSIPLLHCIKALVATVSPPVMEKLLKFLFRENPLQQWKLASNQPKMKKKQYINSETHLVFSD